MTAPPPAQTVDASRLFEEHHEALCRFLVRFTGDPDLAADVAQETFIRLIERPPAQTGGVRAWLFRVAANLARDVARSGSRRRVLLLEREGEVPLGDALPLPDSGVEREEQRRALQAALLGLSQKERTALLMREEGFTQREIADAVGTTTKSVGTLIARAIRKLSNRIDLDRDDLV